MIKLICVGKIKEKYLSDLIADYAKRINKYHKLNVIELKDSDIVSESKEIIKHIGSNDYVVALAIEGEEMSSLEFAKFLNNTFNHYGTITFIIGGSDGILENIKMSANKKLSFSKMTMPHGLFRGVFLEQLYRAFKINNNETYHK
ncbi:MAG: 23S rRNA (pseudouridine(1915)-N(3))-methyltransferase RlmH [bacterium]|nr:23S rRNA (pseudouridine(1915)-N(3))-methyltransferase RlmH [bacterium]